jgi:hypothetical protein
MLVGTLGVLVEVLVGDVGVVPVLAVVVAGWVTLITCAGVELLLDVELLLPQPAINTPANATTSQVEPCLIMSPPLF